MPAVFGDQGRGFGYRAACEPGHEVPGHVGAGGDAGRGDMVARIHPARCVVPKHPGAEAGHPAECLLVRGGRLSVQQPRFGQQGRSGADGGENGYPAIHGAEPVQQLRQFLRAATIQQVVHAPASRHHQQVRRLLQRLVAGPVRHHAWTVEASHGSGRAACCGSAFVGNQQDFERARPWRLAVAGADEAGYGERLDEAPDIKRFEIRKHQDADALRAWEFVWEVMEVAWV
ncbi:hypothetical protein AVXHC19_22540 [Acidovorax sacchari]